MGRQKLQRGLILGALGVGVSAGYLLRSTPETKYSFLGGAQPIRVAEYVRGSSRGILRVWNVRLDWKSVLGQAEKESPMAIVETGRYHGLTAGTIVVPQVTSGRAQLFDTPVREITVIKGKFVRDKSGVEIPMASDGTWSGVRVVEFQTPRFLDRAKKWIQDSTGV